MSVVSKTVTLTEEAGVEDDQRSSGVPDRAYNATAVLDEIARLFDVRG